MVGRHVSSDYGFVDSTISDLGNTSCRMIRGDVLCSSWHGLMNAAFVWFGCSLVIGALLLGRRLLSGRTGSAAVALWCVSGLGSIGVGLVPVNENGDLHGLVALPIFLAQPVALALTASSLGPRLRSLAPHTYVVAALSAVGTVGFATLVLTDGSTGMGALERLALWPGYVWVSVIALTSLRTARPR